MLRDTRYNSFVFQILNARLMEFLHFLYRALLTAIIAYVGQVGIYTNLYITIIPR